MGRGGVGSTRSEFLAEESIDDIRYHRNGGCFVTTKRAIAFVLFAIISLFVVVILMYYYGPNRKLEKLEDQMKDIEELLNNTINEENSLEDIRLPINLEPIHYRLKIFPILDEFTPDNFTYTANVLITIKCVESTAKIVLNADDLVIDRSNVSVTSLKNTVITSEALTKLDDESDVSNATKITPKIDELEYNSTLIRDIFNHSTIIDIDDSSKGDNKNTSSGVLVQHESVQIDVDNVYFDEKNFKLVISLKKSLEVGEMYTLDVKFSANIANNLAGFYRTFYRDSSGKKRWIATTYFQSIFARRAFPCFDEPNFKAPFEISVARRTNMTALSNMPLRETEPISNSPGWVWDHFERSLPMPTYLVSFTICDFHNMRSNTNAAGPVINIWAPENDLHLARYPLDQVQRIMRFFEEFLDIKYPLSKIDLIAFPKFPKNAIGSWGILSFRRSSILLEHNIKSWEARQNLFITLAHELAHQWFGNLVTMKWWNDLWLNEGIGSFMAEVVQNSLHPIWQANSDFPLRVMYKSFNYDSLKSTHGIQTDVTKTSQIEQIFESFVPFKGTSLIRMLNYTLTKPVFQEGLQHYLKTLSFKSADQNTLYSALTEIARNYSVLPDGITVTTLMESWTKQKGYPYLTVERNYETGAANVSQSIFIQDNVNNDTLWYIPFSYQTTEDVIHTDWLLNTRNTTLNIIQPGNESSWVLFNIDQAGYFRVNYDYRNWKLLNDQLRIKPNEIPIASRGQLLDDSFELAKLGILNYSVPLELTKYLKWRESNYIPWLTALNRLEEIRSIINNYEYTGAYENYLVGLLRPKLMELGFKERVNETQNDRILRWRLLEVACVLRFDPCIKWAQNEYERWMQEAQPDDNNPIPVEYRSTILCVSIKTGNRREWDFLWNRTRSTIISPQDLKTAYLSLGCTHDPWLINKYLEFSLSGNISMENIPYVWQSINHQVGIRTGFHFLRLNWNRVYAIYEDVYVVLSSICQHFLSYLSTEIDLQDLTQFYKLHKEDLKSVATLMQASVDLIKLRINWREKHLESVVDWLHYHSRY